MRWIDADALAQALPHGALVDHLRQAFRDGATVPLRHHHTVPVPGAADATLLLMPAWATGRALGVKVVTVFPDNATRGLPSVAGTYLLLDAQTGQPRALLDGREMTLRRTAAASGLAAAYLAREDATHLLMVGTGALAPHLVRAHASQRRIRRVTIWGRSEDKARELADALARDGFETMATTDLAQAAAAADIISCATLSRLPLVKGAWLRPGVHVDLVGGFTPEMREADDDAVRRARVYVDTREGAFSEAGDIVQPLADGVIGRDDIQGDLFELARGRTKGRRLATEITLFKSVGTALEDLAAAEMAAAQLGA